MTPYFTWDDVANFVVTVTAERGAEGVLYRIKGEELPFLAMPLQWHQTHKYEENARTLARLHTGWEYPGILTREYGDSTATFRLVSA